VLTIRSAKLFDWGCSGELRKCTTLKFAHSCANSSAVVIRSNSSYQKLLPLTNHSLKSK